MNRHSARFALLAAGLLLGSAPAQADHRDDFSWGHRGGPRVILFEHANFSGDSITLYPGEEVFNFDGARFAGGRPINDRISSIVVEGGAELLVYEHANFRGHVMRVTESIRNLADRPTAEPRISWNDRISSLVVGQGPRRGPRERPVDPDVVIRRAYEDLLGRAPDTRGLRDYRSLMIDQGWTERMVRDHLRESPEFRRAGADRIIRRAYEDLLGRAPDRDGLENYRHLVIERGYTEQQVRDHIRRSPEFRHAGAERIVVRAYQDLLGRDPDPDGLEAYRRLIVDRGYTEQQVRDHIRRSDEYRQRQHAPPPARPRREAAPQEAESDQREEERR